MDEPSPDRFQTSSPIAADSRFSKSEMWSARRLHRSWRLSRTVQVGAAIQGHVCPALTCVPQLRVDIVREMGT
jgi:hypothetical protein